MVNEILHGKHGQHPSAHVTFAHQHIIKYMCDDEHAFAGIVYK